MKHLYFLLLCTVCIFTLTGCGDDLIVQKQWVTALEQHADLGIFKGVFMEPRAGWNQVSQTACEGGMPTPGLVLNYYISGKETPDPDSVCFKTNGITTRADSAKRQYIKGLWASYIQIKDILNPVKIDGQDNCGNTIKLWLADGSALVYSPHNLDNIFGFNFQRHILKGNWSYYHFKP